MIQVTVISYVVNRDKLDVVSIMLLLVPVQLEIHSLLDVLIGEDIVTQIVRLCLDSIEFGNRLVVLLDQTVDAGTILF